MLSEFSLFQFDAYSHNYFNKIKLSATVEYTLNTQDKTTNGDILDF